MFVRQAFWELGMEGRLGCRRWDGEGYEVQTTRCGDILSAVCPISGILATGRSTVLSTAPGTRWVSWASPAGNFTARLLPARQSISSPTYPLKGR